jgi:RNA polymerase sigma-70 factor (sigma-E family)
MTFEEFAAARLPAVLRFATVLTGDRASGEDAVQDAMIRAHARWSMISQLDRPEYYVRKMIVNEFLCARRRTRRLIPAGRSTDLDHRITPDHAAGLADRADLIAELGKLPPRQRAVLVLRYYEGLSDPMIADVLGVSAGAVRGYASRGLAGLRIEMASAGHRSRPVSPAPARSEEDFRASQR